MKIENLNKYIDHTLVSRDAREEDVSKVLNEAIKYNFKSLCITPTWVKDVSKTLKANGIITCVVIGFPFGVQTTNTKVFEAKDAIKNGADELDFVINVGKLHDFDIEYLTNEFSKIRKATKGKVIKIILEIGLLNDKEIKLGTKLAFEAGFDFIKTSTAIGTTGATFESIKLIKSIVGNSTKIKASGGIKTYEDAKKYIKLGANRLGSSNGIAIVEKDITKAKGNY